MELKLDEMFDAEPEPEIIEGLPASDALTPADRYLELFAHVSGSRGFSPMLAKPSRLRAEAGSAGYFDSLPARKALPRFDLRQFVEDHFWLPESRDEDYVSDPNRSLKEHIDNLWPVLTREPQDHIPLVVATLPQSYIVPGGRFSETYYWDSYFTMLGLAESGREDLLKCMADNSHG